MARNSGFFPYWNGENGENGGIKITSPLRGQLSP